jgi:hypothetical protein
MFRRMLAVALLVTTLATSALAGGPDAKDEDKARAHAAKVREEVSRLGVGPDARVEVRLRDKTKRKGYVKETTADGFVVRDPKTGQDSAVAFAEVSRVNGRNLSTGVKIAIWAGVGVGAVLGVMVLWVLIAYGGS